MNELEVLDRTVSCDAVDVPTVGKDDEVAKLSDVAPVPMEDVYICG